MGAVRQLETRRPARREREGESGEGEREEGEGEAASSSLTPDALSSVRGKRLGHRVTERQRCGHRRRVEGPCLASGTKIRGGTDRHEGQLGELSAGRREARGGPPG